MVAPASEIAAELPQLLSYDGYHHDYSIFLVLRWMWRQRISNPVLLECAGLALTGAGRAPWTHAYAAAVVGRWGNATDLEYMLNTYDTNHSDIDKAEVICSVTRIEAGRRNAFLGQVAPGSSLDRMGCCGRPQSRSGMGLMDVGEPIEVLTGV